jgi:hypothetical protein
VQVGRRHQIPKFLGRYKVQAQMASNLTCLLISIDLLLSIGPACACVSLRSRTDAAALVADSSSIHRQNLTPPRSTPTYRGAVPPPSPAATISQPRRVAGSRPGAGGEKNQSAYRSAACVTCRLRSSAAIPQRLHGLHRAQTAGSSAGSGRRHWNRMLPPSGAGVVPGSSVVATSGGRCMEGVPLAVRWRQELMLQGR